MTKNKVIIGLFLSILTYGCSQSNTDTALEESQLYYDLEIVDSLMIDYLGNLELLSVNSDQELFLFMGNDHGHVFLVNKAGEIISSFEKPSDAPDAFGQLNLGSTFFDDKIAILGRSVVNFYDHQFNLLKNFKKSYPSSGMIYLGFDHLQPGEIGGKKTLIAFTGGPQANAHSNSKAYYREYNTLDIIDLEDEEFLPIIPLHVDSRYAKGEEAHDFIKPLFQVDKNQITFVHKEDTRFYQFQLDDSTFMSETIPFDKFIMNKGYAIDGRQDYETPTDRPGGISQFLKVNNQHLIIYRSGLKLDQLPGPETPDDEKYMKVLQLDKEKLMVRESDGSYSLPSDVSNRFRVARVDAKGRIWALQVLNEIEYEPDMVTIYELKLVKKTRG